jgi:hypothetical protein
MSYLPSQTVTSAQWTEAYGTQEKSRERNQVGIPMLESKKKRLPEAPQGRHQSELLLSQPSMNKATKETKQLRICHYKKPGNKSGEKPGGSTCQLVTNGLHKESQETYMIKTRYKQKNQSLRRRQEHRPTLNDTK